MSYTSSCASSPLSSRSSSISSSPASMPMQIRSSPSTSPSMPVHVRSHSSDALYRTSTMHQHEFSSSMLNKRNQNKPTAYISDEDLFGDSEESPYLSDAPAPPRPAEAFLARPLLPPVTKTRRSSSSQSKSKSSHKHKVTYKG